MAMATFPRFPSLPAELRKMIFEECLFPLIEPRIVAVSKDLSDPDVHFCPPFDNTFSFSVINRSFLRASDSFVVSAANLSQVCKESRDAVRSFHRRFGLPGPQPAFESRRLNEVSLGAPLRPEGEYADIYFWHGFTLLDDKDSPFSGPASSDVGRAKRWLVPTDFLRIDILSTMMQPFSIRKPLMESQHDIIALVDTAGSLRYSDLVIVSADASRQMVIPGLDNEDRDLITEQFEQLKQCFERFERSRLQWYKAKMQSPPTKVFPNLYFAYVNPLKRSDPPQLTQK